jgi:tetratricopeptide (TPR) repeat protein
LERFGLIWGVLALSVCACLGFPLHVPITAATLMVVVAVGIAQTRAFAVRNESANLAYAAVFVVAFTATAGLVYDRVEKTVLVGGQIQGLGELVTYHGDPSTGAELFDIAARFQRFKVDLVYHRMFALEKSGKYQEALDLYDRHKDEGLAAASRLLRGLALERTGRKDEARAVFEDVIRYYQPTHTNYKVSQQALERLQGGQ